MEGHDSQEVDMEGQEIDVEKLDDIEKALCRIKDHYYVLYESRFSIQDIADHLMCGLVTWMGRFLALHLAMFGVIILGRHSIWFNFNITLVFVVAYVGGIMVPTYLGYCREERSVLTALSTLQQYHNLGLEVCSILKLLQTHRCFLRQSLKLLVDNLSTMLDEKIVTFQPRKYYQKLMLIGIAVHVLICVSFFLIMVYMHLCSV